MANPILLTLDDEVQVSNAVERDLRSHFGGDYRIVKATSAATALDLLQRLKDRGDEVALFLVDQRMPEMEGTEFLLEAMKIYPNARRVLLTAYADTSAAISAINEIGLDHYLMKPWGPAEDNLYPVLEDLLDDWQSTVEHAYDGIKVAGTLWSATSHEVKEFLGRSQIAYKWLDIERDTDAADAVERAQEGERKGLPVVFFPDGDPLVEPTLAELAERVGHRTTASEPFYDMVIIGAGPGGLGAAVYGASEGLKTLLIEKGTTGGQAGTSSRIENYLGFPKGVSGADLARRATIQATRLGAEIITAVEVTAVGISDQFRSVTLSDGRTIRCRSLVIATGVSVRTLEVPGMGHLTGAGVYYGAAMTEAANFAGQPMYIVGGANSAGQAAMHFSRFASQVTMLVRGSGLKNMSQYLIDQIDSTKNIDVQFHTSVSQVMGEKQLEHIELTNVETGEVDTRPAAALFLFIGARPHTDFLGDVVERNGAGFVLTGSDLSSDGSRPKGWTEKRDPFMLETSVPGIFAVGDVRQGVVRRVASAVGQGGTVVSMVHQHIQNV